MDERPSKRVKTSTEDEPANVSHGNDSAPSAPTEAVMVPSIESDINAVLDKERQCGMTAFIGSNQTMLTGIFKKRYTDFLVNEILPNGEVLHLKSIKANSQQSQKDEIAPEPSAEAKQEAVSQEADNSTSATTTNGDATTTGETSTSKSKISDEDRSKLLSYFSAPTIDQILALFNSITTHPKTRPRDHPTVTTPFTTDRTLRTKIHQSIRRIFHSRIDSSTNKDGILVLTAAIPNFRNNHHSRVGKLSWIERGGEHCHFTLYKEMKDTMESISFLAHLLKKNPRDFQIAGTKDRRAATVQRVSVWRVEAERLAALNRNQTMKNATLGDFVHHPSGLQLGDLAGNEFTITLRDIRLPSPASHESSTTADSPTTTTTIQQTLHKALSSLYTTGFLNYYGLQRFGTFAIPSSLTGQYILQGNFAGACDTILSYPDAALTPPSAQDTTTNTISRDDHARALAIHTFRTTNSIRDALDIMPKRLSAETALIRSLGRNPTDHLGALMTLQRNMRLMYVHAYQSLIWNKAATARWEAFGGTVVEGDLVLVSEHPDPDSVSAAVMTEDADGEVVIHAQDDDRARSATKTDNFERARPVTGKEADAKKFSIFDIVLPLPGFDVLYPSPPAYGEAFYKKVMAEDGLDPGDMRRGQKDFSLSGGYRKVVARIGGSFDVQVHRYKVEDEQFVETDRERVLGRSRNDDDSQPRSKEKGRSSAHNDEEKKKGEAKQREGADHVAASKGGVRAAAAAASEKSQDAPRAEQQQPQEEEEEDKVAAVLKFQLGTAQYATMALREISRGGLVEYKPGFAGGR